MMLLSSAYGQQDSELDSLLSFTSTYERQDSLMVNALIRLAELHKNHDPEVSKQYLDQGLQITYVQGLPLQRGHLKRALVQYYGLKGNYTEAVANGLEAVQVFDSLGEKDLVLIAQSELIPVMSSAGFHEKAVSMSLKNLELVDDNYPPAEQARLYFTVATSFRNMQDLQMALVYYDSALQRSKQINFEPGIALISVNIGRCYLALGQLEKARARFLSQLDYYKSTGNENVLTTVLEALGEVEAQAKNHQQAVAYYEEALVLLERLGFAARVEKVNLQLYIQYSMVGAYEKADQAQRTYLNLRDSLANEQAQEIIGEMQVKYETEKKEAEIASLKQQAAIQQLEMQQRKQRILFASIILLLVLVIVAVIYRQRSLARKRKQIDLEQRFLRAQLNPHFISNALVSVQTSLLDQDTQAAMSYLTRFARLMRDILENSRKEYVTIEDELEMLRDYLDLNQSRLEDAFSYEINVSEEVDAEEDMIPPMFIQPFVENAIEHGIDHTSDSNLIAIHLAKVNQVLQVTIKDHGTGLHIDTYADKAKQSLSTTIIKERVELFNQVLLQKIRLKIDNWLTSAGEIGGTLVELQIPIR